MCVFSSAVYLKAKRSYNFTNATGPKSELFIVLENLCFLMFQHSYAVTGTFE